MSHDLARIRAFVQVYEAGGFSAAARQHGRSKALLSKYVTDLEDYLGVRLMNRTTRKLSLTEAGEGYYREVSEILQHLDDLDASISDQTAAPRGLLRISAPRNFGETRLAPALFSYMCTYADVTVDLRLEDRFVDLVDEGIDVAIRIAAMADSSLISRKLAVAGLAICASPDFLRRCGVPAHPEDLRGLPCIIDTNMQGPSTWKFTVAGETVSVPVSGPVRVNSPVAAMEAAVAGLGFAAVPSYLAQPETDAGRLQPVLKDHVPEGGLLQAVYPHRRHVSGKVRTLIDHLVQWFDRHPLP